MSDKDIDPLAFVNPARVQLIRKRVEVLDRYLQIDEPTNSDVTTFARELGVANSTFYALARTWKATRDPTQLYGAGHPQEKRAVKILGDEAYLAEIMPSLPSGRTVEQDVLAIEKMAEEAGVKVRSRSALRRSVTAFRAEKGDTGAAGSADVIIDHVVLGIPIETPAGARLPLAAVAIHRPSETVMAIQLSRGLPSVAHASQVLLSALRSEALVGSSVEAPHSISNISFTRTRDADWSELTIVLKEEGLSVIERDMLGDKADVVLSTRALSRARLSVHKRMANWPEDRRLPRIGTDLNVPIPLDEAQQLVDARFALLRSAPVASLRDGGAVDLALRLQRFVTERLSPITTRTTASDAAQSGQAQSPQSDPSS